MNVITRTRWSILLLVCCLGSSPSALSQTGTENYPPPPAGVHWGWQGEVLFDYNRAVLQDQYKPLLLQIAANLRQYPNLSLLITGRADNTGNLEYNRRLSLKRIEAVKKFLIKNGVETYRLTVQNLGEERPVSLDACNEDRPRNRRTDLAFFPTGSPPPLSKPVQGDTQPQPGECEQIKEDLNIRRR